MIISKENTLTGAIIGMGRMGITHYSILNTHPAVKMAGVCDTSAFVVHTLQRHGSVRGFTDASEMFDAVTPDFVIVATPTTSHAQMITEAMARGIHVFVEKPLTLAAPESVKLGEQSVKTKLVSQVGYVNRFNDVFIAVKELLVSGVLGDIHHFRCGMYSPTVLREPKGGWRGQPKTGGGCLLDFASHGIDLVQFLFGYPDRIAGSALRSIYSKGTEDAVYSTFLYRHGLSGHLSVNWSDESYRKPAYRFEIEATNGRLWADQHAYKVFLRKPPANSRYKPRWNVRYATELSGPTRFYLRGNEFSNQLDYFVEKVRTRDISNVNSFASGAATDRIIQAILNDAGVE